MASLITGYHFILYFSFNCSGYGLTVIKKSHTWNCYSCLQKFLLKHKFTNSLLPIYIFSLLPYSINKVKSFMLFTSKKICVLILHRKKVLLQKMMKSGRWGVGAPCPPQVSKILTKAFSSHYHFLKVSIWFIRKNFNFFQKCCLKEH